MPLKLEWEPVYSVDDEVYGAQVGLLVVGARVRVDFAGKEYLAVVSDAEASRTAEAMDQSRIKPVLSIADGLKLIGREEIELWRQVAEYYLCTVGEVYKAAYPAGKVADEEAMARRIAKAEERAAAAKAKAEERAAKAAARALAKAAKAAGKAGAAEARVQAKVERGRKMDEAVEEDSSILAAGSDSPDLAPTCPRIELSPAQTEAYSQIMKVLASGKPALLHGVTGSGKTEVYLKFAESALAEGRNVLFLVPEIALSRQLEDRLRSLFPTTMRVFHSAETLAGRRSTAEFIRTNPYIVLGTRSAVFLPHRDLGLVIVDEEHDTSYKQDSPAPRYNGRETAIMLARTFKARIILGSATPSLEALYNCAAGRFGKVVLSERFHKAGSSDVEIIDTIAERRKNGMEGQFSKKLIARIRATLEAGEQVVLLRERRAYSPVVQCSTCGEIPKCKRCNVPLSLHRRGDGSERLTCHYCGKVYEYSARCPKCGGSLESVGAGTQKIEEEAGKLFPQARIARLDSDTAHSSTYSKEVIKSFSKGETDILVGTQIVTKGFDFSGLTLVAVLQADSILGQEDFRADEKGLQMLEQFRGRCGRRGKKGLFVIQTSQPSHPVYRTIAGQIDEPKLQSGLLEERKVFDYPPYSRAVNVVVKDYNPSRIDFLASGLADALRNSGLSGTVRLIGPHSPTVDKVAGQHIRIIRILLPKDRELSRNKELLRKAVSAYEKERKYQGHISLDVDPV